MRFPLWAICRSWQVARSVGWTREGIINARNHEAQELQLLGLVSVYQSSAHANSRPVTELQRLGSRRDYFSSDFSIFAQLSRSVTVRLKTGLPGVESRSTQK